MLIVSHVQKSFCNNFKNSAVKNYVGMFCQDECRNKFENAPQDQLKNETFKAISAIDRIFKNDMT